ncbi:MAG: hypothetical protein JJU18_03100 [Oceanicaulis sp.]|nr:hypothetical protein [Oceanicaulis sp.]
MHTRMGLIIAAAAGLAACAAASASATQATVYQNPHGWSVHNAPQTHQNGRQYCSLMHGQARPFFQFQFMAEFGNIMVSANEFGAHEDGAMATLGFPSGASANLEPVPLGSLPGILIRLTPSAMDTLMTHVTRSGEFNVTYAGQTHSVRAPDDPALMTVLTACRQGIER